MNLNNKHKYILPTIVLRETLSTETNEYIPFRKDKNSYITELKELYTFGKGILIAAEPGSGKSRLLQELIVNAPSFGKTAFLLDLNKLENSSIESKINSVLSIETKSDAGEGRIFYYSEDFKLNHTDDNIVVCLDALDEVKGEYLLNTIESIKKFKANWPNVLVVISCRNYVFKRHESALRTLGMQLMEILPFGDGKIFQYLSEAGLSKEDVFKILKNFRRGWKHEVINSPRILEIFVSSIDKENTVNDVLNLTKAELLENFIYKKLIDEAKKMVDGQNYLEITKRVLEKLALTMEINHSNVITKDELMTFFDDVDSNLSGSFLKYVNIRDFYNRSLLNESLDGTKIQFQNAEFQEYLAAKEITRFERSDQALFDLCTNKELAEIYTSWANTIRYYFEMKPKDVAVVLKFVTKTGKSSNTDLIQGILLADKKSIGQLDSTEKESIFTNIYSLYRDSGWYLRYDLIDKLRLYFTPLIETILRNDVKRKKGVPLENAIALVGEFISLGEITDLVYWEKELTRYLKPNASEYLKTAIVNSLGDFGKIDVLKRNIKQDEIPGRAKYDLLTSCIKIDPNDTYTIDLLLESIRHDGWNVVPYRLFEFVKEANSIKYYLAKLKGDEALLHDLKQRILDEYSVGQTIENIDAVYDAEIENLIFDIVLLEASNAEYDKFIPDLIKLLKTKSDDVIVKLLEKVKVLNNYQVNSYRLNQIFVLIVDVTNIDKFVTEAREIGITDLQLANFFWTEYKFSKNVGDIVIFELSKSYFSQQYDEFENQVKKYNQQNIHRPDLYEEFQKIITTPDRKYNLFSFYKSNGTEINPNLTADDRKKVKEIVEEVVKEFDFSKAKVQYTDKEKHRYTYSGMIGNFENLIPMFKEFNIDSSVYRKKVIEYLPFAFSNNRNKDAFTLLENLTSDEINYIYDFYTTPRKDNIEEILYHNLYDICRNFKLVQLVPKLKTVVLDKNHEYDRRIQALNIIHEIQADSEFYWSICKKYLKSKSADDKALSLEANKYLLINKNNHQKDALKWRIKEILSKPVKIKQDEDPDDIRFHRRQDELLTNPLSIIDNPDLQEEFLTLFNSAIPLYNKHKDYHKYADIIWTVVVKYFDNLKIYRQYHPLRKFEKNCVSKKKFKGYGILNTHLARLKSVYANNLGKPKSYAESVKIYNTIKAHDYSSLSRPEDFLYIVEKIIEEDIATWISKEGAYRFISKVRRQEDLIQKTIKSQFLYALASRGLRNCDVSREGELLDDKRTDFVISYGFIGRVLIELKLCKNPEVIKKAYEKKLMKYIDGTGSNYGIYLIFQTTKTPTWVKLEPKVSTIYKKHVETRKLVIKGIDCTKSTVGT